MPQAIEKKKITITYAAGAVDYSTQIEAPNLVDAKTLHDIMTVDKLRIGSLPGLSKGTYTFIAVPTTIGGSFMTAHNADYISGASITILDQQADAVASATCVHWSMTGHVNAPIGVPLPHDQPKKYTIVVSINTLTYDIGGGAVTVE